MRRSAFARARRTTAIRCRGRATWSLRSSRARSQSDPDAGRLRLLPRQALLPPAADRAAMMAVVERPFEALEHVVDVREASLLELDAGRDRALAAAADQYHRPVHARHLLHL